MQENQNQNENENKNKDKDKNKIEDENEYENINLDNNNNNKGKKILKENENKFESINDSNSNADSNNHNEVNKIFLIQFLIYSINFQNEINNKFDLESDNGIIPFNENEYINDINLYKLFCLNSEQIKSLKFTISKNGERILLKNAFLLWITYFLIIANTGIFWGVM